MYGINESIEKLVRNDYADNLSGENFEIDCSLGQNPFGVYPKIKFSEEFIKSLDSYPHSEEELKEAISKRFEGIVKLKNKNIALGCGSMGIILTLHRIFLKPNKKVIGVAPQFTAAIDDMKIYEADYDPYFLKLENRFEFDEIEFIEKVNSFPESYIYIDNPNNPTGQVIGIDKIEKIIEAARKNNCFVCIDEAYGDYMDDENSAINLVEKYDNLVVTRSFSKGLGIAGCRVGYAISNKDFIDLFDKVHLPFSVSSFSSYIASQVIGAGWEENAKKKSRDYKPRIREVLKNIKTSVTDDSVPICLYYVDDEDIDLEKELLNSGLRVVSCRGYDGLSQNYVRINLHENFEGLLTCLKKADEGL